MSHNAPATATPPNADAPDTLPDAPVRSRFSLADLTIEHALWAMLILAAIATRFWDLGYRTVHHDESLHTYYSWIHATGERSYVHNPLMHGPFLFHANALIYKIFGASDLTSRLIPAAFGVLLVWLPWLLRGRHFLGRWGALAAGFMLLISPSFLYYTRYIRHDPYMAAGTLLLAIAVFRYLERPQSRWIVIAFVTVAFLLTNHELIFATFLGMVLLLWGALLFDRLRPLIPVHLGAGALLVLAYLLLFDRKPWPVIPWENTTPETTRTYYSELFAHPFVVAFLVLTIGFLVACAWVITTMVRRNDDGRGPVSALFGDARPNTVAYGVYHALQDWTAILAGMGLAAVYFILSFTTFFQNMNGLATATYAPNGTLLYWLGQHDVQRGEQPWFYFITEGFQYEFLGIFFSIAGVVLIGIRTVQGLRGGNVGPNYFFNLFNAWWFVFMFAVLSWAGEKMPWLIIHIALPAFIVGAAVINELVEGSIYWYQTSRRKPSLSLRGYGPLLLTCSLIVLAFAWFLLTARMTYSPWVSLTGEATGHPITQATLNDWWYQAIPPLAALTLLAVAIWLLGPRRTAYSALSALLIVFSAFQIHQGFRMSFHDGDVAIDTMIYNTTSPDMTDVTADFEEMSQAIYGNNDISIVYDACQLQWPQNWYFRDFPNARFVQSLPPNEQPDIIMLHPGTSCAIPGDVPGYTAQNLVLRWHEPEQEVYRRFAIAPEIPVGRSAWSSAEQAHGPLAILGSIGDSVNSATTPEGQRRLFRLVFYREMPAPLTTFEFRILVRNDLLPYYIDARYGGE